MDTSAVDEINSTGGSSATDFNKEVTLERDQVIFQFYWTRNVLSPLISFCNRFSLIMKLVKPLKMQNVVIQMEIQNLVKLVILQIVVKSPKLQNVHHQRTSIN